MKIQVDGEALYGYMGGESHHSGAPNVVFLHGAAMDHVVWTLYSRYWAKAGYNVLALDLPGHGLSGGQPATTVEQYADTVTEVLAAQSMTEKLHLVGHSMGSLIALECAAKMPGTVCLAMMGTAFPMAVSQPLLDAAKANDHSSVDMISLFGHSFGSQLGGNPVAGISAQMLAERLMEQAGDGVMYAGLNACNLYQRGEQTAASVKCPVGLILGEHDSMTPPRAAAALYEHFPSASRQIIEDCGHMMMTEKPEATHRALCRVFEGSVAGD
ncbi:hypothetical protein AB833_11235 [Chromatiales bacterium (ex Bugula neritina AB1)]|nr:hypothetical protein AB833_11235 [Chromatiales bacterium (ex Bugula neritina AB1)]